MLKMAARGGHRELCELARKWACEAKSGEMNWNEMLWHAAAGGHINICKLARKWGATRWSTMIHGAMGGEECKSKIALKICVLAHKWSCSAGDPLDGNDLLYDAARIGSRDLCILARSFGITEEGLDEMILWAAKTSNRELCELAHEWSKETGWNLDYKKAIHNAADRRNWDLCKLISSWMDQIQTP